MPAMPASAGHGFPVDSSCLWVRADAEVRATVPFNRSSAEWRGSASVAGLAARRFHHGTARLPDGVLVRYGTTVCGAAGVSAVGARLGAMLGVWALRRDVAARCLPLALRCAPPCVLVALGR